jgi:5'-nucleotidase
MASRIRFVRVLLTNDDGIEAEGLLTLRRALAAVAGVDLRVVAPDGNRSAMARSITTRRPLWVEEVDFRDGTVGYATDGTPVDCVRLANLGLIDGWSPEMVVSGINHGSNIGDDITYSGTVAAALEAIVLGLPGIAISQQSSALELDFRQTTAFDFRAAVAFTARLVEELEGVPLPQRTLLNVNFPGCAPEGISVARLGRRYYRDELELVESDPTHPARRRYRVYGEAADADEDELDTDIAAIAARRVAVTPLHFDLTHHEGVRALIEHDLERLLEEPVEQQP